MKYIFLTLRVLAASATVALVLTGYFTIVLTGVQWMDKHPDVKDIVGFSIMGAFCLGIGLIAVLNTEAEKEHAKGKKLRSPPTE